MTGGHRDPIARCTALLRDAVLRGDEYTAVDVVVDALHEGIAPESVLLEVIGAVQASIGEDWAANRISVAQEHAATAINDRVISTLALSVPRGRGERGRITVACVDGEWHAFPARLLAEVLRLRGFAVDYLGAQVPSAHLITHLHRTGPDAVALSSSIATRLPTAHATISACQAAGVPVIVGGAAFGADGRYARLLAADAWAPDARAAADTLDGGLPAPARPHSQPTDDLPHLSDQEFTLVDRNATALVAGVVDGLSGRIPEMARYDDTQLLRTAEDVRHIVDFLAVALYTGDPDLFTGFLDWTASVLSARSVPQHVLPPVLDLLADELREFPRASELLATALTTRARDAHGAGRPA
ncbi:MULTISPECIES: cobalamin B12-binding domain-containing protein [Pseudonocardia]|uniref:B12 binding domain protein n=2 Tax=Pseudonocardia TaxID=1847 RepID=A0A1Y2MID8_PSEAH|nr:MULTISPECIES: cobalamin-dependent protein [Pseudonocardia]OSY34841.1 B12 binding domain protein [Pseudonocardia autotrophica]TDN75460.1 methanogenic corrinoid protein MtbC1 [Pseudonocardia autotrophica]BBF99427.1 cobalamin-binding protein [Pseudonocardia autotrophica]GEC29638.1 cobalamin-binding protein [Pseudonocardia saturnea]